MARGNVFVVGELARRASLTGGEITVRLTPNGYTNRARAEPRYEVAVMFSQFDELGFVVMDDTRGHVEQMKFAEVAKWLAKYLTASNCAINIEVPDAKLMAVGYTQSRLTKHNQKFSLVDISEMVARASELMATVLDWVASPRKEAIVSAATNIGKCAALVDWMRTGGAMPEPEPDQPGETPDTPPGDGPIANPPAHVPEGSVNWYIGRYKQVYRKNPFSYNLGRVLEIFEQHAGSAASTAEYLLNKAAVDNVALQMVHPETAQILFTVAPDGVNSWLNDGALDWLIEVGGLYYMGYDGGGPTREQVAYLERAPVEGEPYPDAERAVKVLSGGVLTAAFEVVTFPAHWGAQGDDGKWPSSNAAHPSVDRRGFATSEAAARAAYLALYGTEAATARNVWYSIIVTV